VSYNYFIVIDLVYFYLYIRGFCDLDLVEQGIKCVYLVLYDVIIVFIDRNLAETRF